MYLRCKDCYIRKGLHIQISTSIQLSLSLLAGASNHFVLWTDSLTAVSSKDSTTRAVKKTVFLLSLMIAVMSSSIGRTQMCNLVSTLCDQAKATLCTESLTH
jgi:hypothetical protein